MSEKYSVSRAPIRAQFRPHVHASKAKEQASRWTRAKKNEQQTMAQSCRSRHSMRSSEGWRRGWKAEEESVRGKMSRSWVSTNSEWAGN